MTEQRGVISIAPAVLATVAAYAALAVPEWQSKQAAGDARGPAAAPHCRE